MDAVALQETVVWGQDYRSLEINLYFASGRHLVREEYYRYGFNSFIADVGGYLGLLLGHSILSIFSKATERCDSKG